MSEFESNSINQRTERSVRFAIDSPDDIETSNPAHTSDVRNCKPCSVRPDGGITINREHWSVSHEDLNGLNNARILMQYRVFDVLTQSPDSKKFDQMRMKRLASDIEHYIFCDTKSYQMYNSNQKIIYRVKVALRYLIKFCDTLRVYRVMNMVKCLTGNKLVSTVCNSELEDAIHNVRYEEYNAASIPPPSNQKLDIKLIVETISRTNGANTQAIFHRVPETIFRRKCNICANTLHHMENSDMNTFNAFDVYLVSTIHLDTRYNPQETNGSVSTIDGHPLKPSLGKKEYTAAESKAFGILTSMMHTQNCAGECNKRSCQLYKLEFEHANQCTAFSCNNANCDKIKRVTAHYRSCKDRKCVVCHVSHKYMISTGMELALSVLNNGETSVGTCSRCGFFTRLPQVRTVTIPSPGVVHPLSEPQRPGPQQSSHIHTQNHPRVAEPNRQSELNLSLYTQHLKNLYEHRQRPVTLMDQHYPYQSIATPQVPIPVQPPIPVQVPKPAEPTPKRQKTDILNLARASVDIQEDPEPTAPPVVERRPNKQVRKLHLRDPKSKKRSRDESDM